MPTDQKLTPNLQIQKPHDVLDVLAIGIAKAKASKTNSEPRPRGTEAKVDPGRELLTEKMLADRWVCSIARLQRWRTVGEGLPYLKIVGKVL